MTDLDKLNDKEKDAQDNAMTDVDMDTLSKVSGGIGVSYFIDCPKCGNHTFNLRIRQCTTPTCRYKDR